MLRGVQKVLTACEGGVKKVWRQKFSIAQPPHQSIYEHSLSTLYYYYSIIIKMGAHERRIDGKLVG